MVVPCVCKRRALLSYRFEGGPVVGVNWQTPLHEQMIWSLYNEVIETMESEQDCERIIK
jgi:hypothetical protein